ncbi:helix-turn-helix domain-containing protein [Embleya sp. NPDC001921]
MDALASAIQARLDELGWTQAELSRRSGVSTSTINAWMTGERAKGSRGPHPDKLRAIAKALGLPAAALLEAAGRRVPATFTPEQEQELLGLWNELNEDGREMTLASMRALIERRRRSN